MMVDLVTIARIETLRDEIRHHEYLYFVKARPEITDQEFDALMHELIDLERRIPSAMWPNGWGGSKKWPNKAYSR
jgi:DNA ligase (NAD+)